VRCGVFHPVTAVARNLASATTDQSKSSSTDRTEGDGFDPHCAARERIIDMSTFSYQSDEYATGEQKADPGAIGSGRPAHKSRFFGAGNGTSFGGGSSFFGAIEDINHESLEGDEPWVGNPPGLLRGSDLVPHSAPFVPQLGANPFEDAPFGEDGTYKAPMAFDDDDNEDVPFDIDRFFDSSSGGTEAPPRDLAAMGGEDSGAFWQMHQHLILEAPIDVASHGGVGVLSTHGSAAGVELSHQQPQRENSKHELISGYQKPRTRPPTVETHVSGGVYEVLIWG